MPSVDELAHHVPLPEVQAALKRQAAAREVIHAIAREGSAAHERERAAKSAEVAALASAFVNGTKVDIASIGQRSKAAAEALGDAQRRYAIAKETEFVVADMIRAALVACHRDLFRWVARERARLDAVWRASIRPGQVNYPGAERGRWPAGDALADVLPSIYGVVTREVAPEACQPDMVSALPDRWPPFWSWALSRQYMLPRDIDAAEDGWRALAEGSWSIEGSRFVTPARR